MIQVAMPFLKLTHCLDERTYPEMAVIQKEIYQNLAAILSPFGTGQAGYLEIMMPNMLYIQHFNDPSQSPGNPGEYPDDIPANMSAQRQSKLIICHKAVKLIYDTYKAVTQCLWNQFQEAIHEDYLAELDNPDVGLTNVHPSIIYQHIIDRYVKIDLCMANDDGKQFNAPMEPSKPLAVYTKKQEHCQAFAADASNPIRMADMVQMGVTHAVATGVMCNAYHK